MSDQNPKPASKRLWIILAVVVIIGVVLGVVIFRQRTQPLPVVRINIVTWPGYGPIFLAKDKGFFKDEGVEVDCQIQENTQARNAALISGQVDLIGITLESIVLANAQGVPMQVIGVTDISNGGDGIIAKPEIKTVQDLKGKRVAFPEGQPSHLFLIYHLDKAGLTPDDIKPLYTDDAGKAGELFAAGQVDAAVTWEPWLSNVVSTGRGHILVDSKNIQDILIGILAANRDSVDKNSDKLQRFLRGWYRGLEYAQAHQDESIPIMAKGFQLPPAEFKDILEGLRFFNKDEAKQLLGADGSPGKFYTIAKSEERLWRKAGAIKVNTEIDPKLIYTDKIIGAVK